MFGPDVVVVLESDEKGSRNDLNMIIKFFNTYFFLWKQHANSISIANYCIIQFDSVFFIYFALLLNIITYT